MYVHSVLILQQRTDHLVAPAFASVYDNSHDPRGPKKTIVEAAVDAQFESCPDSASNSLPVPVRRQPRPATRPRHSLPTLDWASTLCPVANIASLHGDFGLGLLFKPRDMYGISLTDTPATTGHNDTQHVGVGGRKG
ncbi:unnamed protein product [Protopolystoma xenopodis]|uniref:Uncharacterized protein n=1 Tax=Protopolystoma xenopodis TaxID=117903 RepID=A0A3S5B152_9PLAT|nr:unnamed protein product [Protopolystoma xenopodis]